MIGGELTMALAEATGARLLPVDSEHSALFQLIGAEPPGTVDRLVLTASGGPFRGRTDLDGVSVEEALAHPTWSMGGRITIDSATLMNKGFEAIEAHHLFGVPFERIEVVVHPQSIVHSLIDLNDGATLAHLGHPDMRVPISYALHYPERADVDVPRLDLAAVGALDLRGARPGDLCLPAPRPRGRQGGGDRTVRAQRRRRGRRRRLPRRPDRLHRDPRRDRARAGRDAGHCSRPTSKTSSPSTPRRVAAPKRRSGGWHGYELAADLPRLLAADHPPRGRALLRREGDRDAGRALLPLLRADDLVVQTRRDRVRGESDPARRLREDHRHEPRGGDSSGGRGPRLLPAAGLEADRRDRRRPGGQHRPRLRDLLLRLLRSTPSRSPSRWARSATGSPAAKVLKPGDQILAVDGRAYRRPRPRSAAGTLRRAGRQRTNAPASRSTAASPRRR